jgi:hypothetical protein
MKVKTKRKATAEEVRRVALAALTAALDDGKQEAKQKPGLTGVRAVATGAVIYTAGMAAFKGRRFVREYLVHRDSEAYADDEELERDDPEAEEEWDDQEEPEAEEEELEEDEEREEPEAEEDLEEDEEEPEDEGDGDDDGRGGGEEPDTDRGPGGSEQEEPDAEEDSDEAEAAEDEERPPTPDLQPAHKPVRPAARKKGKQPSLSLDRPGVSPPPRPTRTRSPLARA